MKPYHPDDSGMTQADKDKKKKTGGNNGGGNNGAMAAFLPGQKRMLAKDLSWGFGGGFGKWKKAMNAPYGKTEIFTIGSGAGNGNGTGKGNPTDPRVPGDPTGGGVTPIRPQNAIPMQGIMPAGILASVPASMPNMAQQQPGGILGGLDQLDPSGLPPEILAILRARQGM